MFVCPVCGYVMLIATVVCKQNLIDWARQVGLLWPYDCDGCGNHGLRLASEREAKDNMSTQDGVHHREVQQRFKDALRPRLVADYNEETNEWEWSTEKSDRARAARK